jgi:hypothetical protein
LRSNVGAYRDEKVDLRFANNVDAPSHQADDCISFGMVLADELFCLSSKGNYALAIGGNIDWRYRDNTRPIGL